MNKDKKRFLTICTESLKLKKIRGNKVTKRIQDELYDLDAQSDYDYFLDLYDRKVKFDVNENNLIIPYLLDICPEPDLDKESKFIQGEFPDIDVDFLPEIQQYLKNEWAPKEFGEDYVCNIGSYGTYQLKNSLLDMARIFDADKPRVQLITKGLPDKNDDGKPIDLEYAYKLAPDLRAYKEEYPEVVDAANRFVNRNKNISKHAGGLIISSKKICDLVPFILDSDGRRLSAWTEGLSDQDLQPVGLIKFDVLSIRDLERIQLITNLIKERHNIENICGYPGSPDDWTDTSYLNDPLSLQKANNGELKGIFQFDGQGISQLVKSGGVTSFKDLIAYSALWRPGPLNLLMHERYVERKREREAWSEQLPECMKPILSTTYGVMVYQEQVMKILNVVGGIPLIFCEKVRKAISKKKVEDFIGYKEQFMINGSKVINWPIEPTYEGDHKCMTYLWDQIESFSAYGFNKSHACAYTFISSMLLYLKTHFPLEFYTITLSMKSKSEDRLGFKIESEESGIQVNPINLNKSKETFSINDNSIYIGFSDVKGIGEDTANHIVANQPYESFEDFLERASFDSRIIKPLIALSVFDDAEPTVLEEYSDYFRKEKSKIQQTTSRQMKRREQLMNEITSLLVGADIDHDLIMEIYYEARVNISDEESVIRKYFEGKLNVTYLEFWNAMKKYGSSVAKYEAKVENFKVPPLSTFTPPNEKDPIIYADKSLSEELYYGFSWVHPLKEIKEYESGLGFYKFDEDPDLDVGKVLCMVVSPVKECYPRNKDGEGFNYERKPYYKLILEDDRWNRKEIIFWNEDFTKFKKELSYYNTDTKRGNIFMLRVKKPAKGFRSFNFESYARNDFSKKGIPKSRDGRLILLNNDEE